MQDTALIASLNDLLQLDHDAAEAYTIAIDMVRDARYRESLVTFRGDHKRHIEELSALVRARGGLPTELPHPTGALKLAVQTLGAVGGDAPLLLAFKAVEGQVRDKYQRFAARRWPEDVGEVVSRAARDEDTHYQWVEDSLKEQGMGSGTLPHGLARVVEGVHKLLADPIERVEREVMKHVGNVVGTTRTRGGSEAPSPAAAARGAADRSTMNPVDTVRSAAQGAMDAASAVGSAMSSAMGSAMTDAASGAMGAVSNAAASAAAATGATAASSVPLGDAPAVSSTEELLANAAMGDEAPVGARTAAAAERDVTASLRPDLAGEAAAPRASGAPGSSGSWMTNDRADAGRFIAALRALEDGGDVERLVSLFDERAEITNPTVATPRTGTEGAREFWRSYRDTFDEIHSDFSKVVEAGDTAMLEWTSRGRARGGEPVTYSGVSVLELENGKVRKFRAYFDAAALERQVNAEPER